MILESKRRSQDLLYCYNEIVLDILGWSFIFVWAIDFIAKAYWHGIESFQFMFFCSILLLFGGIGLLFRNKELVVSVGAMVILMQIPWIIDMVALSFFGKPITTTANHLLFISKTEYLISTRHFFMIPVMVYGISLMKGIVRPLQAVQYTLMIFVIGIVVPLVGAPVGENVNYTNWHGYPLYFGFNFLEKMKYFTLLVLVGSGLSVGTILLADISDYNPDWNHRMREFALGMAILGIVLSIVGYIVL